MPQIEQLYCTHCTYGTSALHRNTGAVKDQVFEYSARAGSVEQMQSHDCFRSIESAMFFHLPGDAPAAEMLKLDGHSSRWRRLVYHPSIGGQQMLAHVCYRTRDTRDRPGSYFAHVLLSPSGNDSPLWRLTDCLKLWNSGAWRVADGADVNFTLDPLPDLAAFGAEHRAGIDDSLLLNFLTRPSNPYPPRPPSKPGIYDHGCIVSDRWWSRPPDDRRKLFTEMLRATLELDLDKQERLLIAAEPGVAALLFYGIARLLPARGLAERLSFSTFESHLDRPTTVLTAFDFYSPEMTDFYPDVYRTRGFVFNTYLSGRRSRPPLQFRKDESEYVKFVVRAFIDQGGAAMDAILDEMAAAGAATVEDLELLARTHGMAASILDPHFTYAPEPEQCSPMATAYLRQRLIADTAAVDDKRLAALATTRTFLPLLDLVGGNTLPTGSRNPVTRLLRSMPRDDQTRNGMLGLENLSSYHKARWLEAYVTSVKKLPRTWTNLWTPSALSPDGMIQKLVERLGPDLIEQVIPHVPPAKLGPFVALLAAAAAKDEGKTRLLETLVARLSADAFCEVLAGPQSRQFLQSFKPQDPVVAARLRKLLGGLLSQPQAFRIRLSALLAGRAWLSTREQAQLDVLVRLRDLITELAQAPEPKKSLLGGSTIDEWESFGERLKQVVEEALPETESIVRMGSPGQLESLKLISGSLLESIAAATFMVRVRRLLMPAVVQALPDDFKLCLFLSGDEARGWVAQYPPEDRLLAERLARMIEDLPEKPEGFEIRLAALDAARSQLSQEGRDCVKACKRLLETLLRLKQMRQKVDDPGDLRGQPVDDIAKDLAGLLGVAFNRKIHYDAKLQKIVNMQLLNNLGIFIIGDETLTGCRPLWPMIKYYMSSR